VSKPTDELRRAALDALLIADPDARCSAVSRLPVQSGKVDPDARLDEPPGVPGRPDRPRLVEPKAVPPRSVATLEGRAALLHSIAHIEFNAIGLALDHVWRFEAMPSAYYRDWAGVAIEEATHFTMLRERLRAIGFDYGDFPAHDGLWQMARSTAGDVLARMALVPRTLEARGLDASPAVRSKLMSVGDTESARIVDIILRDEIGHVAIGNRWFHHLCQLRGLDSLQVFRDAAREHRAPKTRGPLNIAARLSAGFTEAELREIGAA
jgi:uncharacterized ferritin-like protein (DUF455 family)